MSVVYNRVKRCVEAIKSPKQLLFGTHCPEPDMLMTTVSTNKQRSPGVIRRGRKDLYALPAIDCRGPSSVVYVLVTDMNNNTS